MQTLPQFFQFIIDEDAYALEGAGRGMLVSLPGRIGGGDDVGQLRCSGNGLFLPGLDDGPGNTPGMPLLAVLEQDIGSILMSSSPSREKLKPRRLSSSWGEETPRSNRIPSTRPQRSRSCSSRCREENPACMHVSRGSLSARRRAQAMASGSLSNTSRRPSLSRPSRMARLCPPRPNVQSTYNPPGRSLRPFNTSSSNTGVCP